MIFNQRQLKRFENLKLMEWERQNRVRIPFEKSFKNVLKNYFKILSEDISENFLTGHTVNVDIALNQNNKKLVNIFRVQYYTIAHAFKNYFLNRTQNVKEFLNLETKDFDTEFEIALARYIQGNVGTLVFDINETSRKEIQNIIANSLNEGLPDIETSKLLRNSLVGMGLWRATLIARTEVHRTASWANEQSAMQMNIAGTTKEWIAVQDERTRITHAFASGQIVPVEGKFQVGGDLLKYPADPMGSPQETINCRCVVGYTTPDYMSQNNLDIGG